MIQLEKKQIQFISILIAIVFVGSVVAMALTQSGSGIASAATSSVGVLDYQQVAGNHPKLSEARAEFQKYMEEAQKEFESRAQSMTEQETRDYQMQTMQRLQQKEAEMMAPITKSVDDAVKKVADAKGLSVVLDKNAVVYGGQDITQDVIKRLQ